MGENGLMFLDEKVGRASAFFLNKQWTKKLNMKMGNFNYRVDKPTKTWVYMRKKQQQQRIKLSHYLSVLDVYRTTRKMPYANTHVTIHTLMKTAYIINRLDCYWLETNSINNIYYILYYYSRILKHVHCRRTNNIKYSGRQQQQIPYRCEEYLLNR